MRTLITLLVCRFSASPPPRWLLKLYHHHHHHHHPDQRHPHPSFLPLSPLSTQTMMAMKNTNEHTTGVHWVLRSEKWVIATHHYHHHHQFFCSDDTRKLWRLSAVVVVVVAAHHRSRQWRQVSLREWVFTGPSEKALFSSPLKSSAVLTKLSTWVFAYHFSLLKGTGEASFLHLFFFTEALFVALWHHHHPHQFAVPLVYFLFD